MLEELKCAQNWLTEGDNIVVAVVAETWGSAPRPKGSLMIMHADGHFEGSVSGGCVEGTVLAEAAVLMGTNTSKSLKFTVASEDAWQVGLACGGQIRIELFSLSDSDRPAISAASEAIKTRKHGALKLFKSGINASFRFGTDADNGDAPLLEDETTLSLKILPSPLLFVVGAVHIAQALVPMATACGYDVTVIDPRGIFVEERGFAGATVVHDWPDEYFSEHKIDSDTALVTLTHDPKIDDAALVKGLDSQAFYIGSLGSKKTHAARAKRLLSQDITQKDLDRINGPIGLNIGSKSPAEIAISIMAQITASRRGVDAV